MKNVKVWLGALLLSLSGLANAAVPEFIVDNSLSSGLLDLHAYEFNIAQPGVYEASLSFQPTAAIVLFGVFEKINDTWSLLNWKQGAGSFNFNGGVGSYLAAVTDFNISGHSIPYHLDIKLVSAVPEPATWMMLILGVGFMGFQLKRRNSFKR